MDLRRGLEYHPVNTSLLRSFSQSPPPFLLDGLSIDMVEIVFKVDDVSESVSRFDLSFSDETGGFVGVIYKKSEKLTPVLRGFDLRQREYACAVGSVKRFNETTALVIAKITPVRHYVEVLNHRLRVILAHKCRVSRTNRPEKRVSDSVSAIIAIITKLNPYRNRRGVGKPEILAELDSTVTSTELETRLSEMLAGGYLGVGDQEGCYVVNSP